MTRPITTILVVFAVCLWGSSAQGIDFVTKDRFRSETGGYAAYPFRVLFQKLAQADGVEKKKIRTAIIEKQVFDRDMLRRVEAGTIRYQEAYGVVREIDETRLVLWDAQNQKERVFHTGLLAVPTVNPDGHEVSSFNIAHFAVVVRSMDERLYQIQIAFPLAVPDNLALQREGSQNLLRWAEPATGPKPTGYRVHVDGRLYKAVDGNAISIPRKPDRAEEYTVRAVYRHGPALVESESSAPLFDRATATELAETAQAQRTWAMVRTSLNPAQWEKARDLLAENMPLFSARLGETDLAAAMGLAAVFADIEAGDRLARTRPQTPEELAQAGAYYASALEKGRRLAPALNAAFLAEDRIRQNRRGLDNIAVRDREARARETLDRILSDLTPATWPAAKSRFTAERAFLEEHAAGADRAKVDGLAVFFGELDAADTLAGGAAVTAEILKEAERRYLQAPRRATGLGEHRAALSLIAETKARGMQSRIADLADRARREEAEKVWAAVKADLTPDRWPEAHKRLLEQRERLLSHLDETQAGAAEGLLRFFSDIDAGDHLSRAPGADLDQLAQAGALYGSARQTAQGLAGVNPGFIAELKIADLRRRTADAEERLRIESARQMLARILGEMTPEGWPGARKTLDENRDLLLTRLKGLEKERVSALLAFFADIDAGDASAAVSPTSSDLMKQALNRYRAAAQKADALADTVTLGFIAQTKIQETDRRMAAMADEARAEAAAAEYRAVVADLTPARWPEARRRLRARQAELMAELPVQEQGVATALLGFFEALESGDRLMASPTPDAPSVEQARGHYAAAGQAAAGLAEFKGLAEIVRQKISDAEARMAVLNRKSLETQARQTFARIRADLTPEKWPEARRALAAHHRTLADRLPPEERQTLEGLAAFFALIDAGDRIAGPDSASAAQVEQALTYYEQARDGALAMALTAPVGFIADGRIAQGRARIDALAQRMQQEAAGQVLERVLAGLTPGTWVEARKTLMDNRDLLLQNGADADRETVQRLVAFFADIDAGDRFARTDPATPADLANARSFYTAAGAKAQTLAGTASVAFIAVERNSDIDKRIAALEDETKDALAEQTFSQVLAGLTPERWTESRDLLLSRRQLLETRLSGERLETFNQLAAFFSHLSRAQQLRAQSPSTVAGVEEILAAYETASAQGAALAGAMPDITFLTRPDIAALRRQRDELQARQAEAQADTVYGQILERLTPSGWNEARTLLAAHGPMLKKTLDAPQASATANLERFFSEIEEGDRLAAVRPATRADLENAALFYRRAAEKAQALPPAMDIGFLARMRLNDIESQLAAQKAYEERMAQEAARKKGAAVSRATLSGKDAVRYALKDFSDGNYTMALQGFKRVYHKQVELMQKGGRKRLQGVMGLPDKYRAEIVFLVELDSLLSRTGSSSDPYAVEEGLEALSNRIFDGRGMWGIIPQDRREKMANRLESIEFQEEEGR